jgi:hypothetical protein
MGQPWATDVYGGAGDPLERVRCHKILASGPQRRLQVREGGANGATGAGQGSQ